MLRSRFTVKHLEMVHAIDTAQSSTRGAEMLSISQPALSSRLRDAETALGTQLFIRRGRRLSISPAGQLLLRSARTILEELARVENELMHLPEQVEQTCRIGMPQYASFSWLPEAVRRFESLFPNVAIEIVSAAALQPRHALVRDEVDVAIVSSPDAQLQVDASRFLCRKLIHDEFVALLPTNHSKAGRPFLVAEDFVDETYITNSALPEKNREYELFFQSNSMYPERVVQVGFTGAILELVAAGIGTTIGTRWIMASDTQSSKIVSLPLTKKVSSYIGLQSVPVGRKLKRKHGCCARLLPERINEIDAETMDGCAKADCFCLGAFVVPYLYES